MDGTDWLWLVIGIVALVVVVGVVAAAAKRRQTQNIRRSDELREQTDAEETLLTQRETKAAEMDARARAAQAEADAKSAEAERLAATADRQQRDVADERAVLDDQAREADRIDPRTETPPAESTEGPTHRA